MQANEADVTLQTTREAILETFMRDYGDKIIQLVYLMVKDRAIAEDIARALGAERVDVTERWGERLERIDDESPTALRDTVVVCDDVLQRVNDPGAVLMRLRSLAADGSVVVLSAPLRSLADGSLGPPEHASVAREWTFPELQACLDQFNFEPLFGGVLATDVHSLAVGVIVAAVRLQRDQS